LKHENSVTKLMRPVNQHEHSCQYEFTYNLNGLVNENSLIKDARGISYEQVTAPEFMATYKNLWQRMAVTTKHK